MIQEEFTFIDIIYKLVGIICLSRNNHYTSYCHCYFTNKINLDKNRSYYYDDKVNCGEIIPIEDKNIKKKWIGYRFITRLLLFMVKIKLIIKTNYLLKILII